MKKLILLAAFLLLLGVLSGCQSSDACKHDMVQVPELPATCTDAGHAAYYACTKCDRLFADENGKKPLTAEEIALPISGHKLTAIAGTPATCTQDGTLSHFKCETCGKLYADAEGNQPMASSVDLMHHTLVKVPAVLPTTETNGVREHYACSVCGLLFADPSANQPLTPDETVIASVREKLDGVATAGFYTDTHAAAIGKDVEDGGVGLQVLAQKAEDGVYIWYRVNYNTPFDEQEGATGCVNFILQVHGTDVQTLPGPASYCRDLNLYMRVMLDGTTEYRTLCDSLFIETKSGTKTAFTTVAEMFISNEMLASINDEAAACFEAGEDGSLTLKPGGNVFVNVNAYMTADPSDVFDSTDTYDCEMKDGNTWMIWHRKDYADHNITSQKLFVVTDKGLSTSIPPMTDVYPIVCIPDNNAEISGVPESISSTGVLEGTVTVKRSGLNLIGVSVKDIVVSCDAKGHFSADLTTLGLSAHALSLEIKALTVKNDVFATTDNEEIVVIDGATSSIMIQAPLEDYSKWYSAQLAMPATAVDGFELTFTVRDVTNSQAGWPTAEWAAQRFAVQVSSDKNGFFFFTCKGEANIRKLIDVENPAVEGAYVTELERGNAYAWVDDVIRSESGAKMKIEKDGGVYTMSIYDQNEWKILGSVKGNESDTLQVVFMACGSTRLFSDISLRIN